MQLENQAPQAQQSQIGLSPKVPLFYKIQEYQPPSLLSTLSYALIRPPRFTYNEKLLYPPQSYQTRYKVTHHEIPFKLSLYTTEPMHYVILYLHGNSSSRFEGYMHLRDLPDGVGLACFDFQACGMRFGEQYITLGIRQSKEVDIAARFLKNLGHRVVGWGRSMGSVSLLLSQQLDILVADSPFCSLSDLCKQSSLSATPKACCCFFYCIYPCLFSCVKSDVRDKAGFDVGELQVAKIVGDYARNKERALFLMAGTHDSMINYVHSQRIFEAFAGQKVLQLFQGTHNSNRPSQTLLKAFKFIQKKLNLTIQRPSPKKSLCSIKLKPLLSQPPSLPHKLTSRQSTTQQPDILSRSNMQEMLELPVIKSKNSGLEKERSLTDMAEIGSYPGQMYTISSQARGSRAKSTAKVSDCYEGNRERPDCDQDSLSNFNVDDFNEAVNRPISPNKIIPAELKNSKQLSMNLDSNKGSSQIQFLHPPKQ